MPFLGSALGLTVMCSLGLGNLVAFDWNDLPVGREFDCKFLTGLFLLGGFINNRKTSSGAILFSDILYSFLSIQKK